MRRRVLVQTDDFDPGAELARIEQGGVGAAASFTGLVRGDDGVVELFLEHHPVMTAAALTTLADTAAARWPLSAVTIIHRVGALGAGARIVFVAAASAHRTAALEATAFLIDRLKTDAPFWKKETLRDGTSRWVEPRCEDDARAALWDAQASAAATARDAAAGEASDRLQ